MLFLSDDLGWEEVGFNGGTAVPTPNIDRIANEGVKLTQFYVQPSCAPTRASLLTGRHGWKSGLRGGQRQNSNKGMLLDERTIAEALRDVAYKTWIVGKWHLGHWKRAHLPLQRGFDHHYGHYGGLIGSFGHGAGGVLDWHRNGRPVLEEGYSTFLMADEASDLIEQHDGASPFFLYIAFNAVHGPHQAPDEYLAKYGKPRGGTSRKAQRECMDVAVGQVIEALEAKGILDDTLVMFTNDNGAPKRGSNGPYRGFKGAFHEGGVRVPAAVRWPGKISGGSVSDEMLHIVDLFPTFARLAGASIDTGLPLDGLDAWDTIANGAASPRTEIAFRPDIIRVGNWKLIDGVSRGVTSQEVPQLFNLSEDPFEQTNLADDLPDRVSELRERLAYHESFEREPEPFGKIPNFPPEVFGEDEEAEFGEMLRRRVRMQASIRAAASPVIEGAPATFTVSLKNPAEEPLAVSVSVTESGSVLSGTAPSTVTFGTGDTSATLSVPTEIDTVLEAESVVSATLLFGTTYTLASRTTARVTVLDDDAAGFAMSVVPEVIKEGGSATLTVAISNGVTFAEDQAIDLVASGTASAADYTLTPSALRLPAGASSVTAVLAASADLEDEADETVMVAALLGGDSIGSATVTIESVSHDATLGGLSLSGIDIGTFASGTTAYTASVPHATKSATVTAKASHAEAEVSISPGAELSLVEGANEITVTVTAEDGTTTQTYTVTVTRAGPPEVSVAGVTSQVTEGTPAAFTVTLDEAAFEDLTVAVSITETGSMLSGAPPASVIVPQGATSATLAVPTALDAVAEADNTVIASLIAGDGYVLGAVTSASITVEDTPPPAGTFPRPNIVVILSDDMGWGQPGFNGGTEVETPSLDRIANEGVKLTQFYVVPSCSPTRASLLSGRHYWKTGAKDQRPTGDTTVGMLPDERTMAEALRDAGYATWMVGKWHLGQWETEHLPLQRGFDHHYGFYSGTTGYYSHKVRNKLSWHRNGRPVVEDGYATFLLAEEAVQLIERHDGSNPFLLYLAFNAPHLPKGVPPEYEALYAHLPNPDQRGQVKAMDDAIGWVIDALDRRDMLEDTLVVFFNDNGGRSRAGFNLPYRGEKGEFLEGGIRVPAAMRWPGNIAGGSETDALLHVVDLFPTFAGLAGAEPERELALDGRDAWQAISAGAASPRAELAHSLKVMRMGDWKLIEEDGLRWSGSTSPLQLYNISEDPYETTNLASSETAKVTELQERLVYHRQFTRGQAPASEIPTSAVVYGKAENAAYGAAVQRALQEQQAGNLGPTLVRMEAAAGKVKLVYDEALDTSSVPAVDAFTVVVNPGYTPVGVTDVEVSGMEVLLGLDDSPTLDQAVGLTYEVPDSGAIRDVDRLDSVGVTWVTAPVSAAFLEQDATLSALSLSGIDIGTFSAATTEYAVTVPNATSSTTVTATANGAGASVSISPGSAVSLAEGANEITVTVTAADATTVLTYTVVVTRAPLPLVSIAAVSSPVTEGAAAAFEVTLSSATPQALTVAVSVTETGSMLAGAPPVSVTVPPGATSATLSVPTAGDAVVEADSVVTASLTAGDGYAVGSGSSATVRVEDDDEAAFTVSAAPLTIEEGESATLTVEITSGVTFGEDQPVDLSVTGTASAADYSLTPSSLTLAAGASSVSVVLAALDDQEEEADETVTVAASHRGIALGSATVTIESVSHDATLSALGLSGIDIGTFASGTTAYTASVPNATTSATVTAAASHAEATVSISPGAEVSLAAGENIITVTVTAEDGTTKKTYTVTVTRLSLPVVSIAAGTSPVTEGTAASFTVTLDQAAPEALTVVVSVAESGSVLSGTPPAAVTFAKGQTSATLSVATASLTAGDGYAVGSGSSATVRVEDDDEAAFTVSAAPLTIKEGASATLTVEITSGVTFGEDQPVDLSVTGTASAADYSLTPSSLTLAAGASSVSVVLAALDDQEEEADETVTVAASHRGIALGSATVTIESVSHDATLSGLSLSGIDIGTFASGTTAYTASVPSATTSTTVTAAARHAEATVSISPGAEVSLAAGENVITVTVTAQDGTTQKTYTVTVTRMSLPVVSIAAVQQRVSEAELARFTVSRTGPTTEALDVQVLFASTTSETVQTLTVRIGPGESSVTRRVQGGDNTIVEDDVTVTWTLVEGEGYAVSAEHASASVVLEENDVPEFAVSVEPGEIAEGESATVTVAITNGVTFRQPETIALSVSGTASASDYAGLPATLTLRAFGTAASFSATATLTAAVDHEDEEAETVAITASHNGSVIGSAAVTINSVSQDAALSSLSLSGVDIGTFSAETTNYAASVGNSVETTRVTATASHAEASVAISPGSEVSLAEGNNTITVTVTAGDGTTTRIYTVTVTRASLPVVSIAAVASRVSEGERAVFRASLTEPAAETLRVGIRWTRSDQSQSITQQLVFHAGMSSKTPSFSKSDDKVVREDLTVTITLQDGAGYRVSEDARSAQVVLEENDAAEFALAVDPASVAEGETAQVQVRITNGVTFAAGQTIALGFVGGTAAKGTDYTVSAESLTLRAGRRRVTASVTAIADSEQEDAETVTVEASHGGEVIGTATLTITGSDSKPEASGKGFSLAPENGSPSGIWSDGETAWVADLADARLYAYRREDGERQPQKDIATEPSPMGLWSDGETLWVAQLGGGLQAHRLSDGARLAGLDLALEQNAAPTGVWSDGETAWVAEWLGDAVHAYQLSDGQRKPGRDIQLAAGNLMPAGLWSDGQTLWVTDWRERVYAYRLADGSRDGRRDIEVSAGDTDPTGLWSSGEVLLATGWESGEVRAYRLPEVAESTPAMKRSGGPVARAVSLPAIVDPALRVAVGAALSKAPGEAVSPQDLAGLEELTARNAGIRDLSGLEQAHSLKELDLGFNPLVDLRPLADLPALESLNLDGAVTDLQALVPLARLQRLSLRSNGIEDLWPLAGLVALSELDLGDNRIADLQPLAGMGSLAVLRADRNRIADLWPLASLAGLEALDLGANRVQDLQPLAGMGRLEVLRIAGNRLTELHPLSGMKALADLGLAGNAVTELGALSDLTGLLRLDLRGNPLGDLRPLRALRSLVWVHVGGSRIADLSPLDGLEGLTVAGQDDLEAPSIEDSRVIRSGSYDRHSPKE